MKKKSGTPKLRWIFETLVKFYFSLHVYDINIHSFSRNNKHSINERFIKFKILYHILTKNLWNERKLRINCNLQVATSRVLTNWRQNWQIEIFWFFMLVKIVSARVWCFDKLLYRNGSHLKTVYTLS